MRLPGRAVPCPRRQPARAAVLLTLLANRKPFCKASAKVLFFKSRVPLVETASGSISSANLAVAPGTPAQCWVPAGCRWCPRAQPHGHPRRSGRTPRWHAAPQQAPLGPRRCPWTQPRRVPTRVAHGAPQSIATSVATSRELGLPGGTQNQPPTPLGPALERREKGLRSGLLQSSSEQVSLLSPHLATRRSVAAGALPPPHTHPSAPVHGAAQPGSPLNRRQRGESGRRGGDRSIPAGARRCLPGGRPPPGSSALLQRIPLSSDNFATATTLPTP